MEYMKKYNYIAQTVSHFLNENRSLWMKLWYVTVHKYLFFFIVNIILLMLWMSRHYDLKYRTVDILIYTTNDDIAFHSGLTQLDFHSSIPNVFVKILNSSVFLSLTILICDRFFSSVISFVLMYCLFIHKSSCKMPFLLKLNRFILKDVKFTRRI